MCTHTHIHYTHKHTYTHSFLCTSLAERHAALTTWLFTTMPYPLRLLPYNLVQLHKGTLLVACWLQFQEGNSNWFSFVLVDTYEVINCSQWCQRHIKAAWLLGTTSPGKGQVARIPKDMELLRTGCIAKWHLQYILVFQALIILLNLPSVNTFYSLR